MTREELLDKWSNSVHFSRHIPTWTEIETLCFLAEEASKAKLVIECGTYAGRSARVMLDANPAIHLWCIDKFDLVFGMEQIATHLLQPFIRDGQCELINGDSAKGAEMLQHMKGKIDFCFIDDGHAEEDVLRDIRCFLPLLKSGGWLYGHDFEYPPNDVARGVIASGIDHFCPLPRLWAHQKK